jgi:tellurite resistance protein TehA-like permease
MKQIQKRLLMFEVVLCFALPAYLLFWGLLLFPLLLAGAARGIGYVIVHMLCTLGGGLGMVALVLALRYILRKRDHLPWGVVVSGMVLGLVAISATMTGQFTGISLDWFFVLTLALPTFCSVHILWLAVQRFRSEQPNKSLHATCEDARA